MVVGRLVSSCWEENFTTPVAASVVCLCAARWKTAKTLAFSYKSTTIHTVRRCKLACFVVSDRFPRTNFIVRAVQHVLDSIVSRQALFKEATGFCNISP